MLFYLPTVCSERHNYTDSNNLSMLFQEQIIQNDAQHDVTAFESHFEATSMGVSHDLPEET